MIDFHIDGEAGVFPYVQLVQQVRRAITLDLLRTDQRLPPARALAASLNVNANTVFRAYRVLQEEGLVQCLPGKGTMVERTAAGKHQSPDRSLYHKLLHWLDDAYAAGLDKDDILKIVSAVVREPIEAETRTPTRRPQSIRRSNGVAAGRRLAKSR